ncbi:MAG TPA: peptide ABC transporter substrate-binding protein [Gemmatimonadaceae bacterium]
MLARLVGAGLLLTLAACGDNAANAPATGGTVIMVAPSTWTPGPPPLVADQYSRMVSDQLYDRLAEIGPDLNTFGDAGFEPRLARSWTWAKDSLSITFALDPRARWHDGRPVRAEDVRFTLALLKDPKIGASVTALLGNIDSASVKDSLDAVVWFHKRSPEQFYDFVYQVQIMPEHIWASVPRDKLATSDAARAPIGSGRFRFSRFEPGVRFELVADTANYRGRAKLDRIVWTVAPDAGTAVTQLLSGQADVLEAVPPDVIPKVDSSATLRTMKFPGLFFSYLGFHVRDPKHPANPHPVLGDRRVRRALSMALDRDAMLHNVFDNLGTLGSGPFPRALADTGVKLLPFDRAHAAALLDSAGWVMTASGTRAKAGVPLAFSIIVPASSRPRSRYAVLIQEQLKAVGAAVTIESMEFTAFLDRQNKGAFDAALMSTGYDPSPSSVKQSWHSSGIGNGGQNNVGYSNPVFDATLDSAMASFDPARAHALARRANQVLVDDAPGVWLYDNLSITGVHKRIRAVGLRGDEWWAGLADWWIPSGERVERDRVGLRPASP